MKIEYEPIKIDVKMDIFKGLNASEYIHGVKCIGNKKVKNQKKERK